MTARKWRLLDALTSSVALFAALIPSVHGAEWVIFNDFLYAFSLLHALMAVMPKD